MITALVCLHAQASALTRQPLTIDTVSYQCVQKALPNGAPDLAAPDNYYIRVKSHYILFADSDSFAPDSKGTRHVKVPKQDFTTFEDYTETGDARGRLAEAFREILPPANGA